MDQAHAPAACSLACSHRARRPPRPRLPRAPAKPTRRALRASKTWTLNIWPGKNQQTPNCGKRIYNVFAASYTSGCSWATGGQGNQIMQRLTKKVNPQLEQHDGMQLSGECTPAVLSDDKDQAAKEALWTPGCNGITMSQFAQTRREKYCYKRKLLKCKEWRYRTVNYYVKSYKGHTGTQLTSSSSGQVSYLILNKDAVTH